MKKLLSLVVLLAFLMSMFAACTPPVDTSTDDTTTATTPDTPDTPDDGAGDDGTGDDGADTPDDGTDKPDDGTDDTDQPSGFTYNDFTDEEKQLFTTVVGGVIPFLPNNQYAVEEYSYQGEVGINFYTLGNTPMELQAYLEAFSDYTPDGTYEDEYGDTWYCYTNGVYCVDIGGYDTEEGYCVDVYAYISLGADCYTDFTNAEKQLFIDFFGEVIPFLANTSYFVEEYTYEDEVGINFYTVGNTQAEFEAYLAEFSVYTFVETYEDEYGDTWYTYQKGDYYIDLAYYEGYDGNYVDVYVYLLTDSGEGGGSDTLPDTLITNDGKGLPEGSDGVYEVNFTDATNVKDVTDQGYYLDGCPTVGTPAVLVIPVQFSDVTAASRGYNLSVLSGAFLNGGRTDYYSVYDYYQISSYGQLKLDITVLDFWFQPEYASTYYQNATMDYYGSEINIGDQMIMDEALAYLATIMDLSEFDSDGNGTIDAVVLINTLDVGDDDFHWAYRYWNVYTDEQGDYYEYDNVFANDYLWASYQFLHQGFDVLGNEVYTFTDAVNTYTFIHEFGHIIGSDDYYDTEGLGSPMGGYDIMDSMVGDHNAYTKFNYGWITSSRLVTTETSVTLTLEAFSESGDTIIIANNWDPTLGAYQEYYIVVYYTFGDLNTGMGGYFLEEGIVVYHVNASLYTEEQGGVTYYDVYNTNTDASGDYGTSDNLIEYVTGLGGTYVYGVGDSLPTVEDDSGNELIYTFTVDAIEADAATVTFTKVA